MNRLAAAKAVGVVTFVVAWIAGLLVLSAVSEMAALVYFLVPVTLFMLVGSLVTLYDHFDRS